mgnify:CR=1 FL=1
MEELAKEYKRSIKIMSEGIESLNRIKEILEFNSADPERDPEVIAMKERIAPLKTMLNELKTVSREVSNYYKRGWWRSEKYTLNQRKSR